jgi:hypothetical protein
MSRIGFNLLTADSSAFIRGTGTKRIIAAAHVDDIIAIGNKSELELFEKQISKIYEMTFQKGLRHSYIGLDVEINPRLGIYVSQSGYRREVIEKFKYLLGDNMKRVSTPAKLDVNQPPDEDAEKTDKSLYLSLIMSLMFIARLTRPDILFAVTMAATKSSNPTIIDLNNATRILGYLWYYPNLGMYYKFRCSPQPTVFCDASHGIHHDGHGHGCIMVLVGSTLIYMRSYKLKVVTLSSTESEHIVLCDGAVLSRWIKLLFQELGYQLPAITLSQDNTSTISWNRADSNTARTKLMVIRKSYVREAIMDNIIKIVYTPTENMIADIGTKPLDNRAISKFLALCNICAIPDHNEPKEDTVNRSRLKQNLEARANKKRK